MNIIKTNLDQIILSMHARERLAQRALISEVDLLNLLKHSAWVSIHSEEKRKLGYSSARLLSEEYGLPISAFLQPSLKCKHLVIWSVLDESPIIAIVGWQNKQVITILTLNEYDETRITQESIITAKYKCGAFLRGDRLHPSYEVLVLWLNQKNVQNRKTMAWSKIDPFEGNPTEKTNLLIKYAQSICCGYDHNIKVYVRSKKEPSEIFLEIDVDTILTVSR